MSTGKESKIKCSTSSGECSLFESPPPTPSPLTSTLKLPAPTPKKRTSRGKKAKTIRPRLAKKKRKRQSSIRPRARKKPAPVPAVKRCEPQTLWWSVQLPCRDEPLGKWSDNTGTTASFASQDRDRELSQDSRIGNGRSRRWFRHFLPFDARARLGVVDGEEIYLQASARELDWSSLLGADEGFDSAVEGMGEQRVEVDVVLLQKSFLVGVLLNIGTAYGCDVMPFVWRMLDLSDSQARTWKELCEELLGDRGREFVKLDLEGRELRRFAHSLGLSEEVLRQEVEAEAERRNIDPIVFVGLAGERETAKGSPEIGTAREVMEVVDGGTEWLICEGWP